MSPLPLVPLCAWALGAVAAGTAALTESTAAQTESWRTLVEEVSAGLGDPATEADAVAELLDLLDALEDELEAGLDGAIVSEPDARFAFGLAGAFLATHEGAHALDAGARLRCLERVRGAHPARADPELGAWIEWEYAVRLVTSGRNADAETVLAAGLVEAGGVLAGSRHELHARHLLAEVRRAEARFADALTALDELEARLAAFGGGLPSAERELWRARLQGSRSQLLRALGLLDRAVRASRFEGRAAALSGDPVAQAAHALNRADLAFMTEDYASVVQDLDDLASAPFFAALTPSQRDVFGVYLGVALAELEREDRDRPRRAAALLRARVEAGRLPTGVRLTAERYLVDLHLRAGELERARARLDSLRAVLSELPSDEAALERALHATFAARLALVAGADPGELRAHLGAVRAGWDLLLSWWGEAPWRPGGIGFLADSDRREVLSTLIDLVLAALDPAVASEVALDHVLEAEAMGTLARAWGLAAVDTDDVRRELLAPGAGVLLYLPARERSHVFALDHERVVHRELERWDVLRGPAHELQALLLRERPTPEAGDGNEAREDHGRHARRLAAAQRRLSELLLPEAIEARLRAWTGVTVLGAELLGGVPPEGLLLSGGEWLGCVRRVDELPSLAVGLHLARRALAGESEPGRVAEHDLVLVAALEPSRYAREHWPELAAFPVPGGDVRRLCAPFAPERVRVLCGDDAREAELLRADLERVPLVHFLVHGVHVPGRERGAALALPGGAGAESLLTCEDVEGGLEVSGLVLLSACGTARGPARPGDDNLAHLGSAFLSAGAHTVVTSRASLVYEPTLRFMERVHAALAEGVSTAEALRRARASLSEESVVERFAAASIQALGLGQRPALALIGDPR